MDEEMIGITQSSTEVLMQKIARENNGINGDCKAVKVVMKNDRKNEDCFVNGFASENSEIPTQIEIGDSNDINHKAAVFFEPVTADIVENLSIKNKEDRIHNGFGAISEKDHKDEPIDEDFDKLTNTDKTLLEAESDTDCEYLSNEVYHYIIKDESATINDDTSVSGNKINNKTKNNELSQTKRTLEEHEDSVNISKVENPKKKTRIRKRKNTPKKKNSSSASLALVKETSGTTEVLAEFDYDAHLAVPFENISNIENDYQKQNSENLLRRKALHTNDISVTGKKSEVDVKSEIDFDSGVVIMNKNSKFNSRTKPDTSTFRHRCIECEEAFQWPYQLKRHTDIKHMGKYPHYCNVCNKPFERISGLKDHMLVHTEDRPFECEICNKPFKMKGNLKKHIREFHMENPLNFQCEYCAKVFKSKEKLISHFVVHNEEKQYECEVCQKRFHRKNNLIEHRIIHTTDKNFECPECGLSFNRKYALKIHSRNHMEVKPYKCELCPSSFNQMHALKNHIRRHTGEKPYKCTICDKSFAQQSTLQVHTRRHTGEKNYTCGICDQSFVIKRRLTEHFRLHTGEKPYKCDLCPFRATISSGLKGHMKTHMRQLQRQVEKESSEILNGDLLTMIETGEVLGEKDDGIHSQVDGNGDEQFVEKSIEEIAMKISMTHGEGLKEIIGSGMPAISKQLMLEISDTATSPSNSKDSEDDALEMRSVGNIAEIDEADFPVIDKVGKAVEDHIEIIETDAEQDENFIETDDDSVLVIEPLQN